MAESNRGGPGGGLLVGLVGCTWGCRSWWGWAGAGGKHQLCGRPMGKTSPVSARTETTIKSNMMRVSLEDAC